MITYENECVGCPSEIGCFGDNCRKLRVPHFVCDECCEDVEELFEYDDEQLCKDCLLEAVPRVKL